MFTNATCVMIGGKEVQSIVASDGGVLYEKIVDDYDLVLSSNKNTVPFGSTDSVTFSATLTNDDVGVSGETIYFCGEDGEIETYPWSNVAYNVDKQLGNSWSLKLIDYRLNNNATALTIGTTNNHIFYSPDTIVIIANGAMVGIVTGVNSELYYSNGIVYSNGKSIDLSQYSINPNVLKKVESAGCKIIYDYIGTATTNNNGVATCPYTSQGDKDVTIQCFWSTLSDSITVPLDHHYTFDLSSNKSSLSLNNHESATLTATLLENSTGVSGETITFKSISDKYVDDCSLNNLSKYTVSYNLNMSYNNNAYNFTLSAPGTGAYVGYVELPIIDHTYFSFEAKICFSSIHARTEFVLGAGDYSIELWDTDGYKYIRLEDQEDFDNRIDSEYGIWSTNNWYRVVLTVSENAITGEVYDDSNNQIFTGTLPINNPVSSDEILYMGISDGNTNPGSSSGSIKDIKVTGLNNTLLTEDLGTGTTNNNGIATLTYVCETTGTVTVNGGWSVLGDTVQLTVT